MNENAGGYCLTEDIDTDCSHVMCHPDGVVPINVEQRNRFYREEVEKAARLHRLTPEGRDLLLTIDAARLHVTAGEIVALANRRALHGRLLPIPDHPRWARTREQGVTK